MLRTCKTCGEEKEIDLFPPEKRAALGRRSQCRACRAEYARQFRAKHSTRVDPFVDASHRICLGCKTVKHVDEFYRSQSPTAKSGLRSRCKACCSPNPESYRPMSRISDEERRQRRIAATVRWQKNNPEKVAAIAARRTPEQSVAAARRWQKNHPEKTNALSAKRRAMKRGAGGSFTADDMATVKLILGPACLECGTRERVTFDHVVPLSLGGAHSIENIQVLCGPCNSKKGNRNSNDYRRHGDVCEMLAVQWLKQRESIQCTA